MPEQSRDQSDYVQKILGDAPWTRRWTEANDGRFEAHGTLTSLHQLQLDNERLAKENADLRAEVDKADAAMSDTALLVGLVGVYTVIVALAWVAYRRAMARTMPRHGADGRPLHSQRRGRRP